MAIAGPENGSKATLLKLLASTIFPWTTSGITITVAITTTTRGNGDHPNAPLAAAGEQRLGQGSNTSVRRGSARRRGGWASTEQLPAGSIGGGGSGAGWAASPAMGCKGRRREGRRWRGDAAAVAAGGVELRHSRGVRPLAAAERAESSPHSTGAAPPSDDDDTAAGATREESGGRPGGGRRRCLSLDR